jgi:hypothetical protein
MAEQELYQPGFLQIEKLELQGKKQKLDIRLITEELNIFENIATPFMTAELIVNDVTSLFTLFPLTGEETLDVQFTIPMACFEKKPFKKKFRVISIQDVVTGTKVRQVKYALRCQDVEAFADWTKRVRKSYADKPIHEMVKDLTQSYLGIQADKIEIANTEGLRTIVIPNMAPSEALHFLAREAKAANNHVPSNFVFYSSAEKYRFITIEELITKRPEDKYFATEKNYFPNDNLSCPAPPLLGPLTVGDVADAMNGGGSGRKPYEFMKMTDYKFLNIFDLENNLRRGSFDCTVFAIDPPMSKFTKQTYNYIQDYDKFQRTEKEAGKFIFDDSALGKLKGESHERFIITDKFSNKQTPDLKTDFLHYLAASVSMLDYVALEITTPGDPTRRAGDIVRIGFPEYSDFDETQKEENAYLSGDYIVTAVRHFYSITNGVGYQLVMQVMKNCYHISPEQSYKPLSQTGGGAQTPPPAQTSTSESLTG